MLQVSLHRQRRPAGNSESQEHLDAVAPGSAEVIDFRLQVRWKSTVRPLLFIICSLLLLCSGSRRPAPRACSGHAALLAHAACGAVAGYLAGVANPETCKTLAEVLLRVQTRPGGHRKLHKYRCTPWHEVGPDVDVCRGPTACCCSGDGSRTCAHA